MAIAVGTLAYGSAFFLYIIGPLLIGVVGGAGVGYIFGCEMPSRPYIGGLIGGSISAAACLAIWLVGSLLNPLNTGGVEWDAVAMLVGATTSLFVVPATMGAAIAHLQIRGDARRERGQPR